MTQIVVKQEPFAISRAHEQADSRALPQPAALFHCAHGAYPSGRSSHRAATQAIPGLRPQVEGLQASQSPEAPCRQFLANRHTFQDFDLLESPRPRMVYFLVRRFACCLINLLLSTCGGIRQRIDIDQSDWPKTPHFSGGLQGLDQKWMTSISGCISRMRDGQSTRLKRAASPEALRAPRCDIKQTWPQSAAQIEATSAS
jgi:hypothetical protein